MHFESSTNNVKIELSSTEEPRFTNPRTVLEIAPIETFEITSSNTADNKTVSKLALENWLLMISQGDQDLATKFKRVFEKDEDDAQNSAEKPKKSICVIQ